MYIHLYFNYKICQVHGLSELNNIIEYNMII